MGKPTIKIRRNVQFRTGVVLAGTVVVGAIVGPLVAPYEPTTTIGAPFLPPSQGALLGTDALGRDVLSRILSGGVSILSATAMAAALAYAIGIPFAGLAALAANRGAKFALRTMDLILAFPPVLLILILAGAFGVSPEVVVLGTAVSQVPSIVRVVYAASVDVALTPYVMAARLRGESRLWLLTRELMPNISGSLAADVGVRITLTLLLISAANFLGVGVQPPRPDWGGMLAENQQGIMLNPWAVLVPSGLIATLTIGVSFIVSGLSERNLGQALAGEELITR